MKEKIKQIFNWLSQKLVRVAEIIVVIWAVNGMWQVITMKFLIKYDKEIMTLYSALGDRGVNFFWFPFLFYFLSAVLILYLLRIYERKN